jgi:hypothetical protein
VGEMRIIFRYGLGGMSSLAGRKRNDAFIMFHKKKIQKHQFFDVTRLLPISHKFFYVSSVSYPILPS